MVLSFGWFMDSIQSQGFFYTSPDVILMRKIFTLRKGSKTMDSYVTYNPQLRILICRDHGYAIKPSFIARHFQDEHNSIPLVTRQAIIEYSKTLALNDPGDMDTPANASLPIREIRIRDGLECDNCGFSCQGLETMKSHCRRNHAWVAGIGKTWTTCKIQTLFDGQFKRYCRVAIILIIDTSPYILGKTRFRRIISMHY